MKKEFSIFMSVLLIFCTMISGTNAFPLGVTNNHIDDCVAVELNSYLVIQNNQQSFGTSVSNLNYDHSFLQEEQTDLGIILTAIKKGETIISLDLTNEKTRKVTKHTSRVIIY